MTDDKGAGEGPYMVVVALDGKGGFQIAGPNGYLSAPRSLSGAQNQLVDMNLAHAEGRKAEEKEYKELLEITGFLANVLNEIAYGFVHERDDIPGEGCNCNDDYAKAALELSYEDFIDWRRRHGGLNEKH